MTSTIRKATDEERGLAKTVADQFEKPFKKLIHLGEDTFGLGVILKKGNAQEIPILMPSGNVLVLDTTEAGFQIEESLANCDYEGDRTPNGELANAITYASLIREKYLELIER